MMNQMIAERHFEIIKGNRKSIKSLLSLMTIKEENQIKGYFPKTRYYGSKLRLLNWISDILTPLSFETVGDLFGGTGTVSLMFKYKGKNVTYNDILTSNCHMAEAVLANKPIDKNLITQFYKKVTPKNGFISKNFHDIYFTSQENEWLDGAAKKLQSVDDKHLKNALYYCLFQACLQKRPFNLFHRKNLYIRKNCTKKTKFGNWVTWERSFQELIERSALELEKRNGYELGQTKILKPTNASDIKPIFDLVYIDPPYLNKSNNSLNYMDRYHFLEGFCDYENWGTRIQYNKTNHPIKGNDELVNWNSKIHFKSSLFDLINLHKKSIVVLSYASGGYPEVDEISNFFKKSFANVIVCTNQLSHAMKKEKKDEYLFIGM